MSKRLSVQEILGAARRGTPTPAQAEAPQPSAQAPATETPAASTTTAPASDSPRPRLTLQEKLEKAAAEREARASARRGEASPPPAPGGRLTLQEKLEKAAAEREARAAAGTAGDAPRRLTLQEKLEKAAVERSARIAARQAGLPIETATNGKLSIREKLDIARASHPIREIPAQPAATTGDGEDAPQTEPAPASPKRLTLQEKLAAARGEKPAAAPPKPAEPVPSDPPAARPMTIAEKLAAARGGAAAKPSTPAEAPPKPAASAPSTKGMSVQEKLAAARGVAPAAKPADAPAAPASAASTKGMSVQEKLAAARGLAPKPADAKVETAVVETPAPAPAVAPGDRVLPPLAEIADPKDLAEALRRAGAKKDEEAAGRPPGAAPVLRQSPFKPSDAPPLAVRRTIETPPQSQVRADRRGLLVYATWWVVVGWVALAAAIALLSGMMVRFLFPNAEADPPGAVKVGYPTDYEPGEVSERFKDRWGFWVVRDVDDRGRDVIFALQAYCTHLGCPPTWLAGEGKFKCRCHGSGFYKDGVNFEGPAPRPLERYKIGLSDDGQIVVDKGQTFRKDMDQWSDPDCFLAV